jgi:hypothetical protein
VTGTANGETVEKDFSQMDEQFDIGGNIFENDIAKDVQINPADLDYEFIVHPERYLYYGWLAEQAKSWVAEAQIRAKVVYAQQDKAARDRLAEHAQKTPGFRPTEKMVENEAYTSDEHMQAMRELNKAKYLFAQLENCRQAMIQRQFMLTQLGANSRTEHGVDPRIITGRAKEEKKEIAKRRGEQRKAAREAASNPGKKPPVRPGKAAKTA